ncbi:branched-chain amino acid ABC transporter substrate-binding protein [Rhodocyclus tenuis]|uniref:branched-chain amino acid ABC transporter substrate-binding protein n=1 Tax=Rhodocyclus tenuis TaxID=1066 RepID=UPI001905EEE0|nr:branched-chain amino acid ABC transporter substrate-binding protein [Rhodocyclus tenuis]MBK1680915.1 branched chain amino acid ABC transporter substrate-binding protein [Rhodocyclus tenuis]
MKKSTLIQCSAIAVSLALLGGCSQKDEAPATAAPVAAPEAKLVKLGFAAPLTGPQAHYGKEMQNGVVLAVEEANAAKVQIGGQPVRFELVSEDDQADPKQGTAVAQKLVDAKIAGMLGHFNSGTSIPASRIYSEAGIPEIAMATSPAYTGNGYKTTFRAMTNDVQQGSVMGRFAVDKLGAKRIAIVDDRTAYGQGLADEFEKSAKEAGAEIVKREFTSDKASDFMAILTSIKSARPDVLFFGGADAQAGPMARQIKQLGIKATLMGGEMVKSPNFITLGGSAAEGTVASLAGLPLAQMPGGKDYETKYKARFNEEVQIYSPYAYDATKVMIEAMKAAGSSEPAKYLPFLARTQVAGVTSSNIAYDDKGDLRDGAITVYKVEGGEWKVLEAAGK